jgi:hypothetical protein
MIMTRNQTFIVAGLAVFWVVVFAVAYVPDCEAREKVETTKGYEGSERVDLITVTKADGSTVTKGYIGGERVRIKTNAEGTKTKGYRGSERVRVKTKKKDG